MNLTELEEQKKKLQLERDIRRMKIEQSSFNLMKNPWLVAGGIIFAIFLLAILVDVA